jgi:hypothetical protein
LLVHVTKRAGDQHGRPIGIARGRLLIEQRQNPLTGFGSILGRRATVSGLAEASEPILGMTHPPFRRRAGRAADLARIARVEVPPAAIKTILALKRVRCSVFVERTKLASSARSSDVKIIGVASGMILLLMQP